MKTYLIKKIFGPTIQGEGKLSGTVTHFIRFSGCNMWNGKPEDRSKSKCPFCDTDFFGGEKMTAKQIVEALKKLPPSQWVTLSGGEPSLQIDEDLIAQLRRAGFAIAIETNGTIDITHLDFDHITFSPKVPLEKVKLQYCHTLKLLYPHPYLKPQAFENFPATDRYLQPIDDSGYAGTIKNLLDFILKEGGKWKLSLQTHKILGVE